MTEADGVIVDEPNWIVKSCCRVGVAGKTRSSVFAGLSCRCSCRVSQNNRNYTTPPTGGNLSCPLWRVTRPVRCSPFLSCLLTQEDLICFIIVNNVKCNVKMLNVKNHKHWAKSILIVELCNTIIYPRCCILYNYCMNGNYFSFFFWWTQKNADPK